MSDTNKIITEGKAVSDLPKILGFTSDAVVVVVDKGKTAQMPLSQLIYNITENLAWKNSGISGQVDKNKKDIEKNASDIKKIKKNQSDFQDEVNEKLQEQSGDISANARILENALYESAEITFPEDALMNHQYITEYLNIGDKFDPSSQYTGAETGAYAYSRWVGKNDIICIGGLYDMPSTDRSPKIILVDTDGIVIDTVLMSEARSQGRFSFGNKEGTMYLSSVMPADTETVMFIHKTPIDYAKLGKEITLAEHVFYYEDMDLTGKLYDTAAADSYAVYTPNTIAGDSPTTYAHKQEVEPGWILSFTGCQELVRKDASTYLVVVDETGYVRNLFDLSVITENFEYEFKDDEKYFYLSSDALSADPVFKLKKKRMELPFVTEADNGKFLQVVGGKWKAVDAGNFAMNGNEVAY